MIKRILLLLLLTLVSLSTLAHEVRPGYLQIRESEPAIYDVFWKTPAQANMRLALNVSLPEECQTLGQIHNTALNAAFIQHWRSVCKGGLPGRKITIDNLGSSLTDVILRFEPLAAAAKTLRITADRPSVVIPVRQSIWDTASSYFSFGVEHILLGFDHLLFVLCLILLIKQLKTLLWAVTAFTLAHSLTLAATTIGWIHLAVAPVEACIALSIAFAAAEIIHVTRGKTSAMQRWPWIATFCFGLLHGFGFATALSEIGLPDDAIPLALLVFNLGVEAGQLIIISAGILVLFLVKKYMPAKLISAWQVPTYAIGTMAGFWFIDRTMQILLM